LPESGSFEELFSVACSYIARRWSVIPVWGDQQPDRAKVAAVSWSAYQHRKPSVAKLHSWFSERKYAGLAVVTGRVSQLVVLDFDEHHLYAQFQEQFPDLAATYVVQTRRGCHLYYRCLQSVPSRKAPGVDLQSDGRYIIAPPTIVDGHHYQSSDDTSSRVLTTADIQRIQAFFEACSAGTPQNQTAHEFTPSVAVSEGFQQGETEHLTAKDLVALYRSIALRQGRNQALFQTSLRARDSGWGRAAVKECLAAVHARQPTTGQHRRETEARRQCEAAGTIESAFSRPARKPRSTSGQIPNSVRETMLQLGQTSTLRVIEGLYLHGVRPGQVFTYAQAVHFLRGLVGQWSIRRALAALDPQGKPIFVPSPRTPTQANADIELPEKLTKKCVLVSGSKPTKNNKGRPNHRYYTLPRVYELCERFNVKRSGSDTLADDDLRSPRRYRQALHREYIKRRPGQYPRSWLASRLGVSISTEKRYNLALPILVQPRYHERRISWSSLSEIPTGFEIAGTYLVDETGKRYPARQEIAAQLLAKRHTVIFRRQTTNFYCIGNVSPATVQPAIAPHQRKLPAHHSLQEDWGNPRLSHLEASARPRSNNTLSTSPENPSTGVSRTPSSSELQPNASILAAQRFDPPLAKPKQKSKRYYRRPLTDSRMEGLAQQIQLRTNANSNGGMSLYNARRLVDTYGVEPCEAALKRMAWLRRRNKAITNAAGFMVVVSRMMWRLQHGCTDLGSTAPRFRGEPARRRNK
jgi:hypothetical protein